MIKIKDLSFSYRKKKVLNNISLEINDLDIVLLLGENGCGKTTLLKVLANTLKVKDYYLNDFNSSIYISDKYELINDYKVRELLLIYLNYFNKSLDIDYYLSYLNIENIKVSKLSKGNRQKVMLLLAIISNASLILIDEIFDGLDHKTTYRIVTLLKKARKTLIIVTHQLKGFSRINVRKFRIIDGVLNEEIKVK